MKISFNSVSQICLVAFTGAGYLLIALKMPQYGIIVSLVGQIFWFRGSYKAWKEAKQPGLFVNTIIITIVLIVGAINFWFF
jgi:hypothetical protein